MDIIRISIIESICANYGVINGSYLATREDKNLEFNPITDNNLQNYMGMAARKQPNFVNS